MQSYVRSESVVSRVIAGETLIIPVRKGVGDLASIYSLNEVASTIWCAPAPAGPASAPGATSRNTSAASPGSCPGIQRKASSTKDAARDP